jgi:GMP synthase (glutamine-hydrolysing)
MSILIIHHVETNTLGPLEAVLDARKLAYRYVFCHQLESSQVALEHITGLILLGGPQSVAEAPKYPFMAAEQQMIRNAIAQQLPVFGICLGSQMIARSLGATVEKNTVHGQEVQEIGWTPLELSAAGQTDPVLRHLTDTAQFQWHEDTYHLPPGAIHLARTADCPQQAFTVPGGRTYGVQFHPEVSMAVIREWLHTSSRLDAARKRAIWEETEASFAARHAASRRMFNAFCELSF